MDSVPVECGRCHGCSAASRSRLESQSAEKGFEEPEENSLRFEAPLQGNFTVERLGSPRAPIK